MRRKSLIGVCILLIGLVSTATLVWLTPRPSFQDAIVLKSYASLPNAIQGLLSEQVDLLPIDKFDLQTLKPIENNSKVKLVSIPSFDFTYIGLNLRTWPLRNSHFRSAMLYAFDRPHVLNEILGGLGENLHANLFSSAYITSGWSKYTPDRYGYNITKATRLLDDEGFKSSSQGAFRIDALGNQPMRTMFIISQLSKPSEVAAANLFAKDMQSIGLPIISLPMSDFDFKQALRTYAFDMFVDSSTNNLAPTWLYTLFDSKNNVAPVPLGTNLVGYDNSTFDNYVDELMSASDQREIQTAAEKCQEILASDLPVLPVFSKDTVVAASSRITVISVIGSLEDTIRKTAVSIMQDSRFPIPLRIGFTSGFQSLDPTRTSNHADWIALHLLTEPLLSLDQDGKLKPNLAQWMQSYRTLTLNIRPNAKFYTGQNVTANDVVATLNWLIRNTAPSSSIYGIVKEIARVDLIAPSTLKISLSSPDTFAIYQLTDLFALPASRLSGNPSASDFLASQLLVSSGPFALREFTQTEGIYMQLNNLYFGRSVQNTGNFDAFEGAAVFGTQVFSGSLVQVSSLPLVVDGKPVDNASYVACAYDQDDVQTQCTSGRYVGHGSYSAAWRIDSRFHLGTYRVESTLYWILPAGRFMIFEEQAMTVHPLPVFSVLIFAAIIGGGIAIALKRRQLESLLAIRAKRKASKRTRGRRRKR